jgi:hypothetical protein
MFTKTWTIKKLDVNGFKSSNRRKRMVATRKVCPLGWCNSGQVTMIEIISDKYNAGILLREQFFNGNSYRF